MLAAAPALSGGPDRVAALGLLAALAVAAAIALPALRRKVAASEVDAGPEALVRALAEPAALVAEDGAIEATNDAWRDSIGAHRRLQRSPLAAAAALLRTATRDRLAGETILLGEASRRVEAARLDSGRFLLRLTQVAPSAPNEPAPQPTRSAETPARLDAFAAASPFGAALVEGDDPFDGKILEVNGAWASIAGESAAPGATLGPAITEDSRRGGRRAVSPPAASDRSR